MIDIAYMCVLGRQALSLNDLHFHRTLGNALVHNSTLQIL